MKAIGLSLILLCGSSLTGGWAMADSVPDDPVVKNMPYDPKGMPLSVSVEEQKKSQRQKAKAKQVADDILGPPPKAERTPDVQYQPTDDDTPGATN